MQSLSATLRKHFEAMLKHAISAGNRLDFEFEVNVLVFGLASLLKGFSRRVIRQETL